MGVWLDSPDARPVVSDDTEPEIGIKRKNITIPRYGEREYLGTVNYILDEDIVKFDRQI